MHSATVIKAVHYGGAELEEGKRYYFDDINAGELLSKGIIGDMQAKDFSKSDLGQPITHIFAIRSGGIGDLLMMTPALHAWKKKGVTISVAACRCYSDVLIGNPDIDYIVQYPVPVEVIPEDADVFPLICVTEDQKEWPRQVAFAQALGIEDACTHFKPRLVLADVEMQEARVRYPRPNGKPRVGIQVYASTPMRSYPMDKLKGVIWLLVQANWEVFLFGAPGSIVIPEVKGLHNLTADHLDFRQSCAALATCDVVLAPDSALIHVAGALDIPALGLYGPFPWQSRTPFYNSVISINGKAQCAPCWHCSLKGNIWPAGGPCNVSKKCEALDSIPVEDIVLKLQKLLYENQSPLRPLPGVSAAC
jgi:ADP-heptose:LPS heptosyltransferase